MRPSKSGFLEHLKEIAFFLELNEANPFKIRAFRGALPVLKTLDESKLLHEAESGDLTKHKGIGKGILSVAREYLESGHSSEWDEARGDLPTALLELQELKGLGPKKIRVIYEKLGVQSLGELEYACHENRLANLASFGEKTQKNVIHEIQRRKQAREKELLPDALLSAEEIEKCFPKGLKYKRSGELARRLPIVTRHHYLLQCNDKQKCLKTIEKNGYLKFSESDGQSAVAQTPDGHHVQLDFVPPSQWVESVLKETSSSEHWNSLQQAAKKRAVRFSALQSENDAYKKLGFSFRPAEAREYKLKKREDPLLEESDLTGVFHAHSVYSDGSSSLREMADACQKKGWHYLGISDHSQTAFYANGLKEPTIQRYWNEIDQLNQEFEDFVIFKGIESDILKNGKLDYPAKTLKGFDFVIASIHQRYGLADMTDRLIKAIKNPYTTMIGHLTGRLLLAREPYAVDMQKIIESAVENQVMIELNANPHRLDLDWSVLRDACGQGLLISINPDAHSVQGLDDVRYGIWMARKAGLSKKNIFNTWQPSEIKDYLKKRK